MCSVYLFIVAKMYVTKVQLNQKNQWSNQRSSHSYRNKSIFGIELTQNTCCASNHNILPYRKSYLMWMFFVNCAILKSCLKQKLSRDSCWDTKARIEIHFPKTHYAVNQTKYHASQKWRKSCRKCRAAGKHKNTLLYWYQLYFQKIMTNCHCCIHCDRVI